MISFSDHYNDLFIDRLSSKTKFGKDVWHFNSCILRNKDFCSTTKNLLSFLKSKRSKYSSIIDWCEYTKCQIKENARSFSKILQKRKTESLDLKRDCETYAIKKISNLKLNV